MTNGKWDHLNRPLGYEIASLLIDSKQSFSEIKRNLPYEDVNDNEVNRLLSGQETELDIFTIPKTRGEKKYTLNLALFSEEDVERIRTRARARIKDNNSENGPTTPSKSNESSQHVDARNMESRFF